MATMFSSTLVPDSTFAANIQGWATWVEQVVTTLGGWIVTADTGQTAPGSLPAATSQFQKCGYRVYKMNDGFSFTNPIYMRIDFGGGLQSSGTPHGYGHAMWFSFGGGTDGAGNLTGLFWDGVGFPGTVGQPTIRSNNSYQQNLYTTRNYASGDSSRFILGMFVSEVANPALYLGSDQIVFSLERSRDQFGNYTADGLMLTYTDPQLNGGGGITASLNATKYIICNFPGGSQPLLEKGLAYLYVKRSPAYSYDGTVPCALTTHFRGIAQTPGMNYVLIGTNDIGLESQVQINIYAQNHIYQNLRNLVAARAVAGPLGSANPLWDGGLKVSMLFE